MSLRPWCSAPVPRGAALAAAFVAWVVRPALAGGLDDALALVPRDAVAMVAVPSVKSASDDLQLAIDRMGKAEAALGGRPIDLLKAQARVGPGFDDRGAVVAWARPVAGGLAHVVAMPVTDAQAFVSATLVPEPASGEGAMRAPGIDVPLWHRVSGSHVLVSDRKEALAEADVARRRFLRGNLSLQVCRTRFQKTTAFCLAGATLFRKKAGRCVAVGLGDAGP